jgi:hypothetical protein
LDGLPFTIPFSILEIINQGLTPDFPLLLFGLLWLLSVVFIATLAAWMWLSVVIDQMPCFMGVPNCD